MVCCLAARVPAATVLLSGVVSDTNQAALAGASVSLKSHPQIADTTDVNGAFALTGTVTIGIAPSRRAALPVYAIRYTGRVLEFTTASSGLAGMVDLYAADGHMVSGLRLAGLNAGPHRVLLTTGNDGIYGVRLALGEDVYTFKIMSGLGTTVQTVPDAQIGVPAKSAAVYLDTLVVVARGYRHALVGVDNYETQGLQAALPLSNPWRPGGALTHAGNMVRIMAAGYDFEMGQPDPHIWGDQTSSDEQPLHTVQFTRDFWMDTTEVTQLSYNTIMHAYYPEYGTSNEYWNDIYGLGDQYPAYYVQWHDAALYCNARSKQDHLDTVYSYTAILNPPGKLCLLEDLVTDLSKNGYRLPTEAEWEYACRGGSATDFYWGRNLAGYPATHADTTEVSSHAVWQVNAWDIGSGNAGFGVGRVAQKLPNAYGLYDMIGNVYEACGDYWGSYPWGTVLDPLGPSTGDYQTIRGGAWGNDITYLRSANRYFYGPDYEFYFIGFRTVRAAQ
jgi:formylglycine-generating enzyme required for sulfatase activity